MLEIRHSEDIYVPECKSGQSWGNDTCYRLDEWAMKKSYSKPLITGYEIKVSRNDFMNDVCVVEVITTVDSEDVAADIADQVVRSRLAACAQIQGPITSMYKWKGKFCCETEWKIVMKTLSTHESDLYAMVASIHPYETPELISRSLSNTTEPYLQWIVSSITE